MKRVLAVSAIVLALAACKKVDEAAQPASPNAASAAADASPAAPPGQTGSDASVDASNPAASDTAPPSTPDAPQLAMAYTLGLVLPAEQVRPLMDSHQEACERAGPTQCQVLGAQSKADGKDRVSGELDLRATPAWMRMFRDRAEADAKESGGHVADAGTEGDDLTGSIVDTEAAQRARAAERDRLTELMRHKTRNLDQTLQVEQEITRVQGEMDQSDGELAAMKNRIAMQTLTVNYQSQAMVAPDGVTAPLADAGRSFFANVFGVAAVLVTIASYLLPFGLIAAPIVWWARRRKVPPAAPVAPPTA